MLEPKRNISIKEIKKWKKVFQSIGTKTQKVTDKWSGTEKAQKVLGRGSGGDDTVWIDKAAEDIIIKELENIGNVRLISEEAGIIEFGKPQVTIIADPIDGSNNAKFGIPMFAISLSLADIGISLGDVKLGYVRNLATGQEYTAIKGQGSFLSNKRIYSSKKNSVKILGVELSPHSQDDIDINLRFLNNTEKIRSLGTIALDLCYAATGVFDAIIDVRDCIRALDVAAGFLILEESGGTVTDLRGSTLGKTTCEPWNRICFIASGNKMLQGKLLKICNTN